MTDIGRVTLAIERPDDILRLWTSNVSIVEMSRHLGAPVITVRRAVRSLGLSPRISSSGEYFGAPRGPKIGASDWLSRCANRRRHPILAAHIHFGRRSVLGFPPSQRRLYRGEADAHATV